MLSNEPKVQECDTTFVDNSYANDYIKDLITFRAVANVIKYMI
jgi:hypothetical protein